MGNLQEKGDPSMTTFALSVILQASAVAATGQSYSDAFARSYYTGQPLVVLLGADWCPGCVKMKNSVLPEVARGGGLQGVSFAYVDIDREPQLASKLSRGSSIPQLIRFERRGDSWESHLLKGAHSARKVAAFIQDGPDENKTAQGWAARLSGWAQTITEE
jgi:thiol-disulfide isomerase/thioredoxin